MYLILTFESVWVRVFVIYAFNLDCCVEELVLSAAHVRDGRKCLKGLMRLNMHAHRDFTLGNGPDVKVV